MSIGNKIAVSFLAFGLLILSLGSISILNLISVSSGIDRLTGETLPGLNRIAEITAAAKEQNVKRSLHIAATSPAQMGVLEQEIVLQETNFRTAWEQLGRILHSPHEREAMQTLAATHADLARIWDRTLPLARQAKTGEALAMWTEEGVPGSKRRQQAIDDLIRMTRQDGESVKETAKASVSAALFWIWSVLSVSIAVCGAYGYWVVRGISNCLQLSMSELTRNAQEVTGAAGQVSESGQALARGATEQAASLEETSASTEEIAMMVQKNAESCQTVVAVMAQVDHQVTEANLALQQMVVSMREMNSSSRDISKIIKVIDGIAFQTNILSLNAAVEAARAGEAGMGFAVVAEEVRILAQRSTESARDTAALIEQSIANSSEGQARLEMVSKAIRAITESAATVKGLIEEVSVGSQDQARGINHLSRAILEMDGLVQNTASSAEQSAAASQELSAQAESMMAVVRSLHGLVGGAVAKDRRAPRCQFTSQFHGEFRPLVH